MAIARINSLVYLRSGVLCQVVFVSSESTALVTKDSSVRMPRRTLVDLRTDMLWNLNMEPITSFEEAENLAVVPTKPVQLSSAQRFVLGRLFDRVIRSSWREAYAQTDVSSLPLHMKRSILEQVQRVAHEQQDAAPNEATVAGTADEVRRRLARMTMGDLMHHHATAYTDVDAAPTTGGISEEAKELMSALRDYIEERYSDDSDLISMLAGAYDAVNCCE